MSSEPEAPNQFPADDLRAEVLHVVASGDLLDEGPPWPVASVDAAVVMVQYIEGDGTDRWSMLTSELSEEELFGLLIGALDHYRERRRRAWRGVEPVEPKDRPPSSELEGHDPALAAAPQKVRIAHFVADEILGETDLPTEDARLKALILLARSVLSDGTSFWSVDHHALSDDEVIGVLVSISDQVREDIAEGWGDWRQ